MSAFLSHSMRERIAFHLHESETGDVLPKEDIQNWQGYMQRADRILELLREPAVEMNDAGAFAIRDAPAQGSIRRLEIDTETARRCWRVMVEAALNSE